MVYGIPPHIFVTKRQVVFIVLISNIHLTSSPSALLEYFDRFKSVKGSLICCN